MSLQLYLEHHKADSEGTARMVELRGSKSARASQVYHKSKQNGMKKNSRHFKVGELVLVVWETALQTFGEISNIHLEVLWTLQGSNG